MAFTGHILQTSNQVLKWTATQTVNVKAANVSETNLFVQSRIYNLAQSNAHIPHLQYVMNADDLYKKLRRKKKTLPVTIKYSSVCF